MVNDIESPAEDILRNWRQGDYALNVGGFLFAHCRDKESEEGDQYSTVEDVDTSNVVGLLVISQTCDIVRLGGHVAVCALVRRSDDDRKLIEKGHRPSILSLEHAPEENVFADLSQIMSVSKELLLTWERKEGFSSPREQRRLALALERKLGRFAFPDDIVRALGPLRKQASSKHDKDSQKGEIFRSLRQIRIRAAPYWEAEDTELALLVITHTGDLLIVDSKIIGDEIQRLIEKIRLPDGYRWSEPAFEVRSASQFSAEDIFESQALDFQYLSA